MWTTKKLASQILYSSVKNDDLKEEQTARFRDNDLSSEKAESEDFDTTYMLKPRRSRLPHVTANITGVVTLLLLYGLSIYAAVLGTRMMHNHQGSGRMYTQTSAYCKSSTSGGIESKLTHLSTSDGQNPHSTHQEED